ncbi:MAG: type II secretion system F family protein [Chloroflexi bacterium]|nr:type II secretion system F family protein [Chloroflexota bacterium]
MPYDYVAYTADKRFVRGTIDVVAEGLAEEALQRAGYRILSLKEAKPKRNAEELFPTFFGVKLAEVIAFSRQLATLIEFGISLTQALHLLEKQVAGSAVRRLVAGLAAELEGGSSFSQALYKYPHVFPNIYLQIASAGERGGNLESALRQAVDYLERGLAAKQKIKRAMVYPALVLTMAVGVVALLLTVALPPLLGLFQGLGAELPLATKLLIAITNFFTSYKFHLLGTLLALGILAIWYIRTQSGRMVFDRFILRIPAIGAITSQSNIALFSRTMSALLKSGVPLHQTMEIACQTTGNMVIGQALKDVQAGIVQGHSLSQLMGANKLFPSLLVEMTAVGEQTGTLDSIFGSIADFYDQEVSTKINVLISLLEPALTVFIGVVVGFIALSLIMPIYSIMGSIK